jgi:antitoxin component YwqK of YwqJK toxin-antitoxin module
MSDAAAPNENAPLLFPVTLQSSADENGVTTTWTFRVPASLGFTVPVERMMRDQVEMAQELMADPQALQVSVIPTDREGRMQGVAEEYTYNANGTCIMLQRGEYKDSLLNGRFEVYKNGHLLEDATLKNGIRHGITIWYHDNGQIAQESVFDHDSLKSSEVYYEDGTLEQTIETAYNTLQNVEITTHKKYRPTGVLQSVGQYKDGQEHGFFEHNDEDGYLVRRQRYVDGRLRETESFNKDGEKHGLTAHYEQNGTPRFTAEYANGYYHGEYVQYNTTSGTPYLVYNYKNGLADGRCELRDEDGTVRQRTTYLKGQAQMRQNYDGNGGLHGTFESFHHDRSLCHRSNYVHGKLNGQREHFYVNGQLMERTFYEDDKREGPYEKYNALGQVWEKGQYENDKRVGLWHFPERNLAEERFAWFEKGVEVATAASAHALESKVFGMPEPSIQPEM